MDTKTTKKNKMQQDKSINEENIAKAFSDIFNNLLEEDKRKTKNLYGELVENLIKENKDSIKNADDFNVLVNYQIKKVLEYYLYELFKDEIQNNSNVYSILFLYINYGFLERNIKNVIIVKEGNCCCADKTKWVLESYEKFLVDGTLPNMTQEEGCYWKPSFGESQEWMNFCQGLKKLHYGEPNEYLIALSSLIKSN